MFLVPKLQLGNVIAAKLQLCILAKPSFAQPYVPKLELGNEFGVLPGAWERDVLQMVERRALKASGISNAMSAEQLSKTVTQKTS
ncbi:MAG: hypothetical protein A2075_17635 [Geobacteraceae bacterium GWC2_58_44]|nr:MAG: hypothetical protein A2075_17635 [Geobacteraceae bacterium GWC2_58_44]